MDLSEDWVEECSADTRALSPEEQTKLKKQNSRIVSAFQATKLEVEAMKNWDLFYKRNETRFFKDRHWTTREFEELLEGETTRERRVLLEVGCGVGNLVFPLIELGLDLFVYACDFSRRAIEFVKSNPQYDEKYMKAFQADVTTDSIFLEVPLGTVNMITMVFVLSAVHPDKFSSTLQNMYKLLAPGGVLLFRDYGLYDMAQLRFKTGSKIAENFYVRQDGTRAYYFSMEKLHTLFSEAGFSVLSASYVHRRTVNRKKGVNAPRTFVQAKVQKVVT